MNIPHKTQELLNEVWAKGTRHTNAKTVARALVGAGNSEQEIFRVLRAKMDDDVPDKEIANLVDWNGRFPADPSSPKCHYRPPSQPAKKEIPPLDLARWWTSGVTYTPDEFSAFSPVPVSENPIEASAETLRLMYGSDDRLNVVCKYILTDGSPKPHGPGRTLTRDQWIDYFRSKGVPASEAGAWFRLNPCKETGSGEGGAITDSDVTAWKYGLIESDKLPIEMQLALYRMWKLPISAVVLSGGKSAHAWLHIGAASEERYRELINRTLDSLKRFGFDPGNKNPSRLSRLPGAVRTLGANGSGGLQRVLWLNPGTKPLTEEALKFFEGTLLFPCVTDRPLLALARQATEEYEEMRRHVGKLGVPTGIPDLDAASGGWKKGQTIVISGATGAGKTTMGLHCVTAALKAGYGVALFSLEMDAIEIFNLMLSSQCRVDRNKFNTGMFSDKDMELMAQGVMELINLKLFIEDSAMLTTEQIGTRVNQLNAEGKIGMVVVDYIQFINPGPGRDSREQQVAEISHNLRALARETKLPFLVLSQLNEEGKLRESRVIAHNANVVILIENDGDLFTVNIVKARGIPRAKYRLIFDARHARLVPDTHSSPAPEACDLPYSDP